MSNDEIPTREETRFTYEDKPNIVTMLSGGIFMAVALYFITGLALRAFSLQLRIVQFVMAGLVLFASARMAMTVDTKITIDTQSGFIEASNNEYTYQGYAHEPEMFMVLEKKVRGRGDQQYKDYKLTIKVDEETTFDVPLEIEEVRETIENVEKAKKSVPVSKQ